MSVDNYWLLFFSGRVSYIIDENTDNTIANTMILVKLNWTLLVLFNITFQSYGDIGEPNFVLGTKWEFSSTFLFKLHLKTLWVMVNLNWTLYKLNIFFSLRHSIYLNSVTHDIFLNKYFIYPWLMAMLNLTNPLQSQAYH